MNQPQRDITLRFLAEPQDVNFGGKVHGGAVSVCMCSRLERSLLCYGLCWWYSVHSPNSCW